MKRNNKASRRDLPKSWKLLGSFVTKVDLLDACYTQIGFERLLDVIRFARKEAGLHPIDEAALRKALAKIGGAEE